MRLDERFLFAMPVLECNATIQSTEPYCAKYE
jgi:hypothetical protein